jgi:hypothetical protein
VASSHKDEIAVGEIGLIRFAQSRTRSNISMQQRSISINAEGRYEALLQPPGGRKINTET